jgi:hypothetical protein
MSDTARMKRLAPVAVLLGLVAACGGGSAKGVRHGTMAAVYGDLRRNPAATYKVRFKAAGFGVKRVTAYWKHGKARIDTVGTRQNTRHYPTAQGLIQCDKKAEGFDCFYKQLLGPTSFRLLAGPDWKGQTALARAAGVRPSKRKILGQTVDCWSYAKTEGSLEQETCVNEVGAILSYRGGNKGDPYQAVAVSYTTTVSDAEVRPPKARQTPQPIVPPSTIFPATTTVPPPP